MKLNQDITAAANKLRWRYHYHSQCDSSIAPFRVKWRQTPLCNKDPGNDIDLWCKAFRRRVSSIAAKHYKHFDSLKFAQPPIVRAALRQLKNLDYYVIPNDKQAGYSLISRSDVATAERASLKASVYQPINIRTVDFPAKVKTYRSIARRVGKQLDAKNVEVAILSSLKDGIAVTALGYSCKTHKEQGEVSLRVIHKGLKPCWEGLSMWVHKLIMPVLNLVEFLAKDSHETAKHLRGCRASNSAKVVSIDLKDFFCQAN